MDSAVPSSGRGRSLAWNGLLIILAAGHAALAVDVLAAEPRPLYQGPRALTVSRDAKTAYVACADARQIACVNLVDGKVVRRIDVPAEPMGVALSPDGSRLFVACAAPKSTVAVLAVASGESVAAIAVGHTATALAISPDGTRLYVCNRFDNNVSVVDVAAGKELMRIPAVREPIAATVTPDGRTVLVANHLPNTRTDDAFDGDVAAVVTAIDTRTLAATAIPLSHSVTGVRGLCVSPDGRHALVTHLLANFQKVPFRVEMGWIDTNVVSILDLQQRKVVATIGMDEQDRGSGNPWDVVWTADGMVCVSLSGTHELCVIESGRLLSESARSMTPMVGVWPIYPSMDMSHWRRLGLPGKGPRGLAAAGPNVVVAEYFSDTLAVVEAGRKGADGAPPPARTIAMGPPPQWTQERRGEFLFHDASICEQEWLSCASCHPDGRGDGLNWDLMNDGVGNSKNTKSMVFSHRTPPAMAEGVRMTAEDAVRAGISHILFAERPEAEAAAIDAYLKSLRPVPSPLLQDGRMSAAAVRGGKLFQSERVGCVRCHPAPLYTDMKAHNVGSRGPAEYNDRFDTPTLVEVWRTAPYLHDGRYPTLLQLLTDGQHGLRNMEGTSLSPQELRDLVEFVLSL